MFQDPACLHQVALGGGLEGGIDESKLLHAIKNLNKSLQLLAQKTDTGRYSFLAHVLFDPLSRPAVVGFGWDRWLKGRAHARGEL